MADGIVRGFLAESLFPITGLATAAFLSRSLGPADYGIFSIAAVFTAWIEFMILSCFARATIKLVSEAKDFQPVGTRIVQVQFLLSLIAVGCVWGFSGFVAEVMAAPQLAICACSAWTSRS